MFQNIFRAEQLDMAAIEPYLKTTDLSNILIDLVKVCLDNKKQRELVEILKRLETKLENLEEVLMIGVADLITGENSPTLSIAGKVEVINCLMELQNDGDEGTSKLNLTGNMTEGLAQIIIQVGSCIFNSSRTCVNCNNA